MSKMTFRTSKTEGVQHSWTSQNRVQNCVQNKSDYNQQFSESLGQLRTVLRQCRPILGQIRTSLNCITLECLVQGLSNFSADAADLSEKDFTTLVNSISDLAELEGFANRRRVSNAPQLKSYSEWQKEIIIEHKWRLEHDTR